MKKKLLYLLFPVIALILEILPYGAVCNFAAGPDETIRETFSYFDLTPFGYANFAPFLTAILTCAIFALLIVYLFLDKPPVLKATKILVCIGALLSLCPTWYSVVGVLIAVCLIAELLLLFGAAKKSNKF